VASIVIARILYWPTKQLESGASAVDKRLFVIAFELGGPPQLRLLRCDRSAFGVVSGALTILDM
jgi:hypothetical protein